MTHHVQALRRAQLDVEAIVHWLAIERKSPQGAATWLQAYEQAALTLAELADSCPVAPESQHVEVELRQLLFKTRRGRIYRLLFTIEKEDVFILRVRGPGQAPVEPIDLV